MRRFRPGRLSALLAILAVALGGGGAQPEALEERLLRLESEVGALRRENQQLRADLGLEGRAGQALVTPGGRESRLGVGGLLQVQGDFGDRGDARFATGNDRFYLRRARLHLQGRFPEGFDFRLEGEFAGGISELSGNRAQLTDAFINWNRFEFVNVRVGQFKSPFGFEQLYLDPRLFLAERTLVNDRLTAGRQVGVQAGGELFNHRFSYATGLFNGTGANTSANDNDRFFWAGRIGIVPWEGVVDGHSTRWTFGVNALTSDDARLAGQAAEFGFDDIPGGPNDNIFTGRRKAGGLDTQFQAGPFELWIEYLRARFKPLDAIPARSFDAAGWYVQVAYFAVPKALQLVTRYDTFDPNLTLAGNNTRTWTVGGNWFLKSDDIKLQLDYLMSDIDGTPAKGKKLILRLQTIF